ncbi:hypothetical protein SH580_20180 [Coraliomargarita algicola]|uniref:PEP-CTERM protein-sorting domain-containing protein n=1 Tax=Coraliomargarita algicola TaxID=3092156 RepID=A0ABZ0RHU1_9BACT|nr:hypothetical protein [Coraliomargarita sp. J2-16]WPJ95741.1 hypothetical protein SH580_20180 [Coraliomargarita sp. J2-16]
MKTTSTLLTAIALIGSVSYLSAQTIYSTDYDTFSPYSQNDSTTATGVTYTFSDSGNTNGLTGAALSLEFDASAVTDPEQYALNMFTNQQATGTLATSENAADYNLEFDISALGLTSSPQTLLLDVRFDGNSVNQTVSNLNITDTGFTHVSLNLATIGFTTLTAANINSSLSLKFYTYNSGGVDKFGRDAGNAVYVDNVTLTQIPEPSTFAAIAGLLALTSIMIRRRS